MPWFEVDLKSLLNCQVAWKYRWNHEAAEASVHNDKDAAEVEEEDVLVDGHRAAEVGADEELVTH